MNIRNRSIIITSFVILLVTAVFSLKCGVLAVSWQNIADIFTDSGVVLRELRLARTLAAILAGASLAISGVILQKILRNDLASPDILGISGGAGFAGITLLLICPEYSSMVNPAAFCGALAAAVMVYFSAWKRSPAMVILAGVAFGAIFNAASGAVMLCNADRIVGIFEFTLGGFSARNMSEIYSSLPFFALVFASASFFPRRLDLLSLGDDTAHSLGIHVRSTRFLALMLASLAAATAASVAGLLGFTGLMAPHIAGKLLNNCRCKEKMPLAAVIGAELTLLGDIAGRLILAPRELPAGLFLSASGAVFFLYLLLKERKNI